MAISERVKVTKVELQYGYVNSLFHDILTVHIVAYRLAINTLGNKSTFEDRHCGPCIIFQRSRWNELLRLSETSILSNLSGIFVEP